MSRTIIVFNKKGNDYTIENIESPLDLSSLTDMKDLEYDKDNTLSALFKEDGVYKWIGILFQNNKKYLATTLAFVKM